MASFVIECPKIGTGTMEDPFRPDLTSNSKIKTLLDKLELKRQAGEEINEETFFLMRVKEIRETTFLVEIIERNKTIDDWINELSQ